MDKRKYYEDEVSRILGEYQHEELNIISFYQSKIIGEVMKIDNEQYLMEIYNLAHALATK